MKTPSLRTLLAVGAAGALVFSASAQVIELRATINGAQENPAVTTPAAGNAVMLYDVGTNTFDLIISITGLTNTVTASHIHEAAMGVNGAVVTNLGGEAVYFRSGNTLTATFRNITHSGDRLRLIQGGAYFNLHTAANPGGEVRGQLIARPVRLVANLDVAQEAAAFPALNFSTVNNFGGAVAIYDPTANTISVRHSLFNYSSTFTNSHIHAGAPGVSGAVNTSLGTSATAGAYNSTNGHISGSHETVAYGGNPIELLTGLNYLNYHSQAFAGGQLRGQLTVSGETLNTRLGNLSVRGFVGTGEQVLIGGISVQGTEPVRVLITAKGPALAAFGVTGAIPNPRLALFSGATQIAANDDVGALVVGSELARIPAVPTNPLESALVVVLPPGNYTAIVSSAAGTGVALLEAYDLRNVPTTVAIASLDPVSPAGGATRAVAAAARPAPELCVVTPLPTTVATR
ncbi:MAG: CHRD domain-containing protein [Opitutaceae bacterium]|nr:CHRD domain-containing protein [Opitutaceae bacterium]